MLAAFGFIVLVATPVMGAERRTMDLQLPESAVRLPVIEQLPPTNQLQLALALPLRNQDALTNLLQQLYDRHSTNFHRFLTPAQFAEQFGPTEQDYQRVKDFATANHLEIANTFGNRALLDVSETVADVEKSFQVHLGLRQHPTENRNFFGPDVAPSVDASLPISYIAGLDNYEIPQPKIRMSRPLPAADTNTIGGDPKIGIGSGTNGWYLGSDFRNAYVPGVSLRGTGQVVGLVEFDGYTPSDITKYKTLANLPNVTVTNILTAGVSQNVPGQNNGEVCLDIEVAIAMSPSLSKVVVVEGGSIANVMNALASPPSPDLFANQISSSWGGPDHTNYVPQLLEMAAQGQSFFYATGDYGAPANGIVTGPYAFQYITMVGGTELEMNGSGASWQSEEVWDYQYIQGASTGYIATGVPIPDYQKTVNMAAVGGSSIYRNVPDVAMCADYIELVFTTVDSGNNIIQTGTVTHVGGTSAAAPLWAAFTALVNQQAVGQGKPTVGFLNPALYEIGQGSSYNRCFHDVTSGNNTNSASNNHFFAATGYDLCTGWGSPNGINMINALVGYTGPIFVDFNYTGALQNGGYDTPYKTLAQGTAAVSSGGTIFIKTAGTSPETMTISKPMTVTANDGAATVGR